MTTTLEALQDKAGQAVNYLADKGLPKDQAADLVRDLTALIGRDQENDFPALCPEALATLNTVIDYAVRELG